MTLPQKPDKAEPQGATRHELVVEGIPWECYRRHGRVIWDRPAIAFDEMTADQQRALARILRL